MSHAGDLARSSLIDREVVGWPGITAHLHRFGGTEYRLGRREIGHVHGETLVDVPLPRRVRDQLIESGTAQPHHVLPDSGWVSVPLRAPGDVAVAVGILRQSYDLARAQRRRRNGTAR
ncbi:MAG TPA: luciferase family protein [Anaerolineales bacterium]|nr:luciferase family protein [Anaerolineales bacterium]